MKEQVIVEYIDENKVVVYLFDETEETIIGSPIVVCKYAEASVNYEIVGELADGRISLYNGESIEEEDYDEFSLVDEEDDNI